MSLRPIARLISAGFLLVMLTITSGCVSVTPIRVSVNAFAASDAQRLKKFVILPGNPGLSEFDLGFLETKDSLERSLLERGFLPSSNPRETELYVFVSYGIGAPQVYTRSYQVPVYGQISGGVSTVNAVVMGPRGPSTVVGTVVQQPVYGVTGYQTSTSSTVTYTRWARIDAIDAKEFGKSKNLKSVWEAKLVSTGTIGDLRLVLPSMLRAGADFFGKSSGREVEVQVAL